MANADQARDRDEKERAEVERTVDGHRLKITHPDKVMYPATGTTKADVVDYYVAIAPRLLPHVRDRAATRKRWIEGVGTADNPGDSFFHKDLDSDAPTWMRSHTIRHSDHTNRYPVLDSAAALVWFAQRGALEFHVPQWRFGPRGALKKPDRIVFDLDPGRGASFDQCIEAALAVRALLQGRGIESVPVTSGSKGIHIYGALDGSRDSDQATDLAHELATTMEHERPSLAVSNMRKEARVGKVLIDWSQNRQMKTTVAPLSLRGRMRPCVAFPMTWDELTAPGAGQVEFAEALATLQKRADPLAEVLKDD